MAIKYYKLIDLLHRRGIPKLKLRDDLSLGQGTIAKFSNNEPVTIVVIDKLCKYLKVQPGDLMEYVDENDKK